MGDGVLVLFDPAVPAAILLSSLVAEFATQLAVHNGTATEPRQMRLRIAVHEGHVLADAHGHSGEDLNHTFRLLDARATRTVLASHSHADAVLVISDAVYQGVVRHRYLDLDPGAWQPVRVHAKETRTRAWVHLPGLAHQPSLPSILTAEPVGPANLPLPHELPMATEVFTGRIGELQQLDRLLDMAGGAAGRPVVISAINGMGGVGKSALAIYAAHRIADRFPDGQLYVNLHGATPGHPPVAPLTALGQLLRSLGVDPAQVPLDVDEAAARWRSLAAERRLLVVLDNAHSSEQCRPLVPAGTSCAVLVTSRQVLANLDGARSLHLDLLPADQAVELLAKLAGQKRLGAEPQAAYEVVRHCGYLPLAIRVAGARLTARPAWPVSELARRLSASTRRLAELTVDGLEIRAAFDVSLAALKQSTDQIDQAAAQAFGLWSLPNGPDLDISAAAALVDENPPNSQSLLERLVDAKLMESPRPGRYQFHDLVRLHARHHAATTHPEPERLAALQRLLEFYAATAWHTYALLRPGDHRLSDAAPRWAGGRPFPDSSAALEWLESERANLMAAISQATTIASAVLARLAIELTHALRGFFHVHSHWTDCVQANQTALTLARRTNDKPGEARVRNDLGGVFWRLGQYDSAIEHLGQALTLCEELGDRRGQAAALNNLGIAHERLGRYEEAIDHNQQSLAICQELGDIHGQADSLNSLGVDHRRLQRYPEAIDHHLKAVALFRQLGAHRSHALALGNLGLIYELSRRYPDAINHHRRALEIFRETDDRYSQVWALRSLGEALLKNGRQQQAREAWQEALELCQALQLPEEDELRERLATSPPSDRT